MASIVGEEGGMHYHQGADGNLEGEYVTEKFVRHRPKIPVCISLAGTTSLAALDSIPPSSPPPLPVLTLP